MIRKFFHGARSGAEWFLPFVVGFALTAAVAKPMARVSCVASASSSAAS